MPSTSRSEAGDLCNPRGRRVWRVCHPFVGLRVGCLWAVIACMVISVSAGLLLPERIALAHSGNADALYIPFVMRPAHSTGESTAPNDNPPPDNPSGHVNDEQEPDARQPDARQPDEHDNSDSESGEPDTGEPDSSHNGDSAETVILPDPHAFDPGPLPSGLALCDAMHPNEIRLAYTMRVHPDQGRATLTCDPILTAVARAKAEDMARRNYIAHSTPEGLGPNQQVRDAGYSLPDDYSRNTSANHIEALAAGARTTEAASSMWMSVQTHRVHLLGLDTFFAQQTHYGIGYIYLPATTYGHYWVVLTAPPAMDRETPDAESSAAFE